MTSDSIYPTKFCPTCSTDKPTSEFNKDPQKKDGLRGQCKSCTKKSRALHYLKNRDRLRENTATYYIQNREKVIARNISYSITKPDEYAARTAKRRAVKFNATPKWYEHNDVEDLYKQCRHISEVTGIKHHVDHIVPLQSNIVCGLHCLANLQIIPASDNHAKYNSHWPDMP